MSDRCGCDACAATRTPHAAWTGDGFCAFCADRCFPVMTVGGVASRARATPEARRAAHGAMPAPGLRHAVPGGAHPAGGPPPARLLAEAAIANIPDARTRANVQAAVGLADTLLPFVAPEAARALRTVRKFFKR